MADHQAQPRQVWEEGRSRQAGALVSKEGPWQRARLEEEGRLRTGTGPRAAAGTEGGGGGGRPGLTDAQQQTRLESRPGSRG